MATLEQEFDAAMLAIYQRAKKECGYTATRFLQMLSVDGGLKTARRLLDKNPSDGFAELYMLGRLDLTVEAHVVNERFALLFTEEERRVAAERLRELGCGGPSRN